MFLGELGARRLQLAPEAHVPEVADRRLETFPRRSQLALIALESTERRVAAREVGPITVVGEDLDASLEVLGGLRQLAAASGHQTVYAVRDSPGGKPSQTLAGAALREEFL